jgi:NADH-quinone oxidoreductase subunit C
MDAQEIKGKISEALGDVPVGCTGFEGYVCLDVRREELLKVVSLLKEDPSLRMDFLMGVTGVDLAGLEEGKGFRVIYHLFSYTHKHTIVVRVDVPKDDPTVPSLAHLYGSADWNEREVYDLFGIVFKGHPDLRRILLPEEWIGHPLRKDYKQPDTIIGFPATRTSLMEKIRASRAKGKEE